jgi:hypothetical protein
MAFDIPLNFSTIVKVTELGPRDGKSQVAARTKGDARTRTHSKSSGKTHIWSRSAFGVRGVFAPLSKSNLSPSVGPKPRLRWAAGSQSLEIIGSDHLHASRGHSRVSSSDSPVSRRLLRLARICGHPLDTAWMNFEPSLSIS